jgi:hypothetical protein
MEKHCAALEAVAEEAIVEFAEGRSTHVFPSLRIVDELSSALQSATARNTAIEDELGTVKSRLKQITWCALVLLGACAFLVIVHARSLMSS